MTAPGRKPGENPGLPHVSRAPFSKPVPAHVTLRLLPGLLSLRTVQVVREIERTFADGCERSEFRLVHYSLQGNHAHLIVEARDRDALGRGMMAIGSRLARAVNRVMERDGPRARRPLPRASAADAAGGAERAPLRAAERAAPRGGDERARPCGPWRLLDPASSARWFDGWRRRHRTRASRAAPHPPRAPPVARARTWLLTTGWRRHGLLDPRGCAGERLTCAAANGSQHAAFRVVHGSASMGDRDQRLAGTTHRNPSGVSPLASNVWISCGDT